MQEPHEETYCSEEGTTCNDWAMYGECVHQTSNCEPKIDPVTEFVIQQLARQAGL